MSLSHDRSREIFDRSQEYLPGGVNSPVRAFGAVGGQPLVIARGEGPYLYDVDGNRYIDYVCSWGPLILGHAHPAVVEAVQRAAERGTSYGAPTEAEAELAQLVVEAVPSIEMVRFVNSGTEATMSALRLARAYTGRDKVVKFEGCYHGHADGLLVQAGSGVATLGLPDSPGVPASFAQETLVARFNDAAGVEALFERFGEKIAAVIVEPVAANMGVVPPLPGFLASLRAVTERAGSLLIFDEVVTGFRVAYGGAQSLFGVMPDLTCLGKIIGGGLPVGAYGGKRRIMEMMAPLGPVYQAGTLSGNPLAMAAGLATLRELQSPGFYERLDTLSSRLVEGAARAAASAGVSVRLNRVGSMRTPFFVDAPVVDYESARRSDRERYARFFHDMLERGVYLAPSQFEAAFVSAAHGESQIDATIAAAAEVLPRLARRSDSTRKEGHALPSSNSDGVIFSSRRNAWLRKDDAALLKECSEERYRASGPGGQRRNKVETAVRLRHLSTGLVAQAEESRYLAENRVRALKRLRERLALELRAPFDLESPPSVPELDVQRTPAGGLAVNRGNPSYPIIVATLLDAVEASQGSYAKAARALGVTTSQLLRFLRSDPHVQRASPSTRRRVPPSPA